MLDTVDYYADDRPIHLTPGLHDTRTIVDAARARDWQVADGRVREVDGLRVLTPRPAHLHGGNLGAGDVLRTRT